MRPLVSLVLFFQLPVLSAPFGPEPTGSSVRAGEVSAVVLERPSIVWIPAGDFRRGSSRGQVNRGVNLCAADYPPIIATRECALEIFQSEMPRTTVRLSAYGIDRVEVSHARYQECVLRNRCAPSGINPSDARLGQREHPVADVSWHDAVRYCEFRGGRLPTEAEWERAARGNDGRMFPWGRLYNPRLANHGQGLTQSATVDGFRHAAPVGSYPSGASYYGLLDMAGNVWEWTQDRWDPLAYEEQSQVNPITLGAGERVIRGGSWRSASFMLRAAHRARLAEDQGLVEVGFRCAYDASSR